MLTKPLSLKRNYRQVKQNIRNIGVNFLCSFLMLVIVGLFHCSDQNCKKHDLTNLLKNVIPPLLRDHEATKHERTTSGFVLLGPTEVQSAFLHGQSLAWCDVFN